MLFCETWGVASAILEKEPEKERRKTCNLDVSFWAKHMNCKNSIWACWSFEQNRSCVVFEVVLKMRRRKADWARGEGLYTTGVLGCTCSANEAPTLHPGTRLGEKSSNTKPGKVKGWKHLNCLTTSSPAPHHPSKPATASPNPRKRSTHMLASILQCPHTPEALTNTPKPTAQNPSLAQTAA